MKPEFCSSIPGVVHDLTKSPPGSPPPLPNNRLDEYSTPGEGDEDGRDYVLVDDKRAVEINRAVDGRII